MTDPTTSDDATDDAADRAGGARAGEDQALQDALAAEQAAIWGHGVIGAAVSAGDQPAVAAAEETHRDTRDQLAALLAGRGIDPVAPGAAYALPFPVVSATDAAALGVLLEDGVATAWVAVLDRAVERSSRELAVQALVATELRAVGWRARAGRSPVTEAFPGL